MTQEFDKDQARLKCQQEYPELFKLTVLELKKIKANEARKNKKAILVNEVLKLRAEGQTLREIGEKFGVTKQRIGQITKEMGRKDIDGTPQ